MGARAGCYTGDRLSLISPAARVCRGEPRFRQSDLGLRDASLRLSGGVNASGTLTAHALYPNSGARSLAGSSTEGVNLGSMETRMVRVTLPNENPNSAIGTLSRPPTKQDGQRSYHPWPADTRDSCSCCSTATLSCPRPAESRPSARFSQCAASARVPLALTRHAACRSTRSSNQQRQEPWLPSQATNHSTQSDHCAAGAGSSSSRWGQRSCHRSRRTL